MANLWRYDEANDKWIKVSEDAPLPVTLGAEEIDVDIDVATEGLATSANQTSIITLLGTDGIKIDSFPDISVGMPTPLKADRITAITTSGGNVAQTGIEKADLINSGNTTLTIWFGEAIATGKAIYLPPGSSWTGYLNNESAMYYDSDANGGQLDYVLMGSE